MENRRVNTKWNTILKKGAIESIEVGVQFA